MVEKTFEEESKECAQKECKKSDNSDMKSVDLKDHSSRSAAKPEKNSCCEQLEQLKNTVVHVSADFENFKKRTEKEKLDWIALGKKQFILDLLEIVDDFDRALQEHKKKKDPALDAWLKGFELIGAALHKLLEKHNVHEIKQVETFDPEIHEALTQVQSDQHKSGEIVSVLQKGFMFGDSVLRPAKVSVAK